MKIEEQQHGGVTAVRPNGPISGDDATLVRDNMLRVHAISRGRVVLDLSKVPFVDSKGLEAFLDVTEAIELNGQALKLCGENEVVREILEVTDLASLFEHFDDVTSAVRSFL